MGCCMDLVDVFLIIMYFANVILNVCLIIELHDVANDVIELQGELDG